MKLKIHYRVQTARRRFLLWVLWMKSSPSNRISWDTLQYSFIFKSIILMATSSYVELKEKSSVIPITLTFNMFTRGKVQCDLWNILRWNMPITIWSYHDKTADYWYQHIRPQHWIMAKNGFMTVHHCVNFRSDRIKILKILTSRVKAGLLQELESLTAVDVINNNYNNNNYN